MSSLNTAVVFSVDFSDPAQQLAFCPGALTSHRNLVSLQLQFSAEVATLPEGLQIYLKL